MTNILVSIWGVIPTNTIAFQQYALSVMMTQAAYFSEKWNLEIPKPITTNEISFFSATPKTNSWNGTLGINNLYSFMVTDQSFWIFSDTRYYTKTFVGHDEVCDALAQKTSCLTLEKSLSVARHALDNIGLKEFGQANPTSLKQWKYESNGVTYPLPLYDVRWQSDNGVIDFQISGISSNVAEFSNATVQPLLKIPMPTNYLSMLGLPPDSVFIRSRDVKPPDGMFVVINKRKLKPVKQ